MPMVSLNYKVIALFKMKDILSQKSVSQYFQFLITSDLECKMKCFVQLYWWSQNVLTVDPSCMFKMQTIRIDYCKTVVIAESVSGCLFSKLLFRTGQVLWHSFAQIKRKIGHHKAIWARRTMLLRKLKHTDIPARLLFPHTFAAL